MDRCIPKSEVENLRIADIIEKIHTESPDKGYRRIRDELERYYNIKVNDKGYSGFAVRKESNLLLSILTMGVQDRRQIPSLLQKTF